VILSVAVPVMGYRRGAYRDADDEDLRAVIVVD
jgi:hypothetical protein